MARSVRQQRYQLAVALREDGQTWVEISKALQERWPELTPRSALRFAHTNTKERRCWTQQDAADEWAKRFPDERTPEAKEISRWETWPRQGGQRPSFDTLDKLAQLYECGLVDLLADISDYRHLDEALRPAAAVVVAAAMPSEQEPVSTRAAEGASALGVDLWELHEALLPSRINPDVLDLAERSASQLGTRFPELPPRALSHELGRQLDHVVGWLREPQPAPYRKRLCSLAGNLAALRGWLLFDMAEQDAADVWFSAAVNAGSEVDDDDLCAWLLGARSLIPTDRQDHRTAVDLIARAQSVASRGASLTTRAWLALLESRAHAGIGDRRGFEAARQRAAETQTTIDQRRHGMDFAGDRLDLTYYDGLSLLALGEPCAARESFDACLQALPGNRLKARTMLSICVALAVAHDGQPDEAAHLTARALEVAEDQPIRRAWQRANEVRGALDNAGAPRTAQDLDNAMAAYAAKLEP